MTSTSHKRPAPCPPSVAVRRPADPPGSPAPVRRAPDLPASPALVRRAPDPPASPAPLRRAPDPPPSPAPVTLTPDSADVRSLKDSLTTSSSVDEQLTLTVVLPDRQQLTLDVDSSQSVLDLLIMVCSKMRLNPSDHTVIIPNEIQPEWPMQTKPSQSVHSLGVSTVHVVPKKSPLPTDRRPTVKEQPFEMTYRVTINLPLNQKHVVRVAPSIQLAQLLKMTADTKRLDAERCELRHPTTPDIVLDLRQPLNHYGLTEVTLVTKPVAHRGVCP